MENVYTLNTEMIKNAEEVKKFPELIKTAYLCYKYGDSTQNAQIINLIFPELFGDKEKRLYCKTNETFSWLKNRIFLNGRGDEPQSEPPTTRCTPFIEETLYELKAHFDQSNSTGFKQFYKMVLRTF